MNKKEIKGIFREIEQAKKVLKIELEEINDDVTRSGEYKQQQRLIAIQKAEDKLHEIRERAGNLDFTIQETEFDYSNPDLLAALNFIELAKENVTEAAVRTMIDKLADKPKELAFLGDVLGNKRMIEYAALVNEAVTEQKAKSTLPQRLDDVIYYATDGNPEKEVSFAEIEAELDAVSE